MFSPRRCSSRWGLSQMINFSRSMLHLFQLFILYTSYYISGNDAIPDYDQYKYVEPAQVNLSVGKITGNKNLYTYDTQPYPIAEFLGIPFAEPPINNKRFLRPTKLEKLPQNPFLATKFGPGCLQNVDKVFENPELYTENLRKASYMWNVDWQSEDCLTLNVWTPYPYGEGSAPLKPVMLWVYGGGFYSGGSSLEVYLGYRLSALEDVVVVTFNYRVGVLGFLQLDELEQSGNQGLYDQLMVMQWVQDHIRYFGGDPDKVTLFGESAGGASIGIHMISPLSQGLFSKAILQSGSPTAIWAVATVEEKNGRVNYIRRLIEKSGCGKGSSSSDPEVKIDAGRCLQYQSAQLLLTLDALLWNYPVNRYMTFPMGPYIDGEFIPESPKKLLSEGKFANVPVMVGSNRNEGSFFLVYFVSPYFNDFDGQNLLTSTQFEEAVDYAYRTSPVPISDSVKFFYRDWVDMENGTKNRIAVDDATGAENFLCPINEFAELVSEAAKKWPEEHSENIVYMYSLRHRAEAEQWPRWMGVVHGADCEWIFGKFLDHPNSTGEEKLLNRKIMSHWASFARSSNPNMAGQFDVWPQWTSDSQKAQFLDTDSELKLIEPITIGPRIEQCAFWNKYLPRMKQLVNESFVNGTLVSNTAKNLTSKLNKTFLLSVIFVLKQSFLLQ